MGACHESKCHRGAFIISRLDWGWRVWFEEGTSHAGKLVLAVGQTPQFCHVDLSLGHLTILTAVWLGLSRRMVHGREKRENLSVS